MHGKCFFYYENTFISHKNTQYQAELHVPALISDRPKCRIPIKKQPQKEKAQRY